MIADTAAVASGGLDGVRHALGDWQPYRPDGRVHSVVGLMVEAEGLTSRIGAFCEIAVGEAQIDAEVVGLRGERTLLLPLRGVEGLEVGAAVRPREASARVPSGRGCLGRVLDGTGRPMDGGPPLEDVRYRSLESEPVSAVERERIQSPLDLGVRAIDAFATVGQGMRMGIFAGSGVGKSTLLGQLASQADVDVCVIALIGERRREVREFIERDLGEALSRSVVVVSTSDESAALRTRAARVATGVAEGFRDEGARVLLMMDSLTRFCTAQREIGLAVGEPPTTRGYTPSVWSALPRLVERAGTSNGAGCITGLYTVLVEGDDMNEAVAGRGEVEAAQIALSLPTIHCSACISKIERALNAHPQVTSARVNLTLKRASIDAAPDVTAQEMEQLVEGLGYEAHELDAGTLNATATDKAGRDLLMRLAVAGFASMNVMLLSVAVWSGAEAATRDLFHWISAAIALPTIAFAGQPFFRNAWAALSKRRLNMDVPITLAILLAVVTSLWETVVVGGTCLFRRGAYAYLLPAGGPVS